MTSLRYVVSVILVVLTLANIIGTCKSFKGLKHQSNFAHVYGKRTANVAYSQQQTTNKKHKYPLYEYQKPFQYSLEDILFPMRRKEPEVTTTENVARVTGRQLYYDDNPKWINLQLYGAPEVEQDELVNVPEVGYGEMLDIPRRQNQKHIGDIGQDKLTARRRFLLQDMPKETQVSRLDELRELDNIIAATRQKV